MPMPQFKTLQIDLEVVSKPLFEPFCDLLFQGAWRSGTSNLELFEGFSPSFQDLVKRA
jgi:hypothetical protein